MWSPSPDERGVELLGPRTALYTFSRILVVLRRDRRDYLESGHPPTDQKARGDYGIVIDGVLVAAVERKSMPDLIASLTSGRLRYALGELAALPRAAVVVEDRYSEIFKQDRVRPALVADGIAECQVRWPNIPIVFCETRGLAEEWTYRYLAAAHTWASTEPAAVERIGEQSTLRPVPEHQTGPSPAEIRDWARQNSIHVPTAAESQPPSAKPGNARQPRLTPDITAPDVLGWLPLSPGKITRVTAHWGRSRPPRASVVGSCAGPGELLANWRAITAGQPGCWSSRQAVLVSVWGGSGVRFLPAGRRRVGGGAG